MATTSKPSLGELFVTFLKIGSTSFGGFMALVSVVQDEMVERKKQLSQHVILDGISLASVLPGPLAVNVVTYIGFHLRGIKGALVAMLAVILPSFVLVYLLSYLYFMYGDLPGFESVFKGITPAVTAIILSVAVNMARKNIKDIYQVLILIFAAASLLYFGGVLVTFLIILSGGILGAIIYRNATDAPEQRNEPVNAQDTRRSYRQLLILIISILAVVMFFAFGPTMFPDVFTSDLKLFGDIITTFSGMSISLFGGGYVIIPIIKELIVGQLGWLNDQEFVDGIAMGQITPGPILISAAFIGYKLKGLTGAFLATVAIFLPPGVLMMLASNFLRSIKSSPNVQAIFKGLRPAVIGMIFSAVYTLGKTSSIEWGTGLIFFVVLLLFFRFKIGVVYLIPAAGLLGYLIF